LSYGSEPSITIRIAIPTALTSAPAAPRRRVRSPEGDGHLANDAIKELNFDRIYRIYRMEKRVWHEK